MEEIAPAQRPMRPERALTADAIRLALAAIPAELVASPQYVHEGLSSIARDAVVIKVESTNPVGSFKGRGTWIAVHALARTGAIGPGRPVVVGSTGNFGQGVAYAARAAGVEAIVFCPEDANPRKVDRIRRFGAQIVLAGRDFDDARAAAERHAADAGLAMLVDGDDVNVAVGAATIALELTDGAARGDLPRLANAYVPVGNGSLIVGIGSWLRAVAPGCRVVGVQAVGAPAMERSWRLGTSVETTDAATYADGIATRVPVPAALELMNGRVDEMLLVGESALYAAQGALTSASGVTAEGAAASSWAGLLADRGRQPGASLVLVTGANVAGG